MKKNLLSLIIGCTVLVGAEPGRADATSVFTTFPWPLGNGTLIVGCNKTLDDVTQPVPSVIPMAVQNANAEARCSKDVSKAGDHAHEGCITLDILPSPLSNHVCFDVTQKILLNTDLGYQVIYLEKLHPSALYDPTGGKILHPETMKNCFQFLKPGGVLFFDLNHGLQSSSVLEEQVYFTWLPEGRIKVHGPNPIDLLRVVTRGRLGEILSAEEDIKIYKLFTEFYGIISDRMHAELREAGFVHSGKKLVATNSFNQRKNASVCVSALKPE